MSAPRPSLGGGEQRSAQHEGAPVSPVPLAVLHTEASCGWGGQEIRILTEMEEFRRRGHRVHLLAPARAGIYAAARERGLAVDALPIEFRRVPGFLALRRWLLAHGGDFHVINTHSSADSWLVALVRSVHPGLPPLVRTRHVSTRVNRSRATRWLYQTATAHIVVTGEALKRQLQSVNGFDPQRITSVPTGIDLDRFAPADRDAARAELGIDDRPAVAIVATLRDWKGHDDLIDAWVARVRARAPGWQVLVVGDGPRRAHLEARVQAARLEGDFRFVGSRDDVPRWLSSADIVTLPSWGEEGVPQSLIQAAACARPVVSTHAGAIAEAVVDGETGLLVAPRDVPALAEALIRLMHDAPLRARFGAAGREHAVRHFAISTMASRMEAVFERVLRERR